MPGSSTATAPSRRPRRQQTTLLERKANCLALTPSMLTGVAVVIQRFSAVNRGRNGRSNSFDLNATKESSIAFCRRVSDLHLFLVEELMCSAVTALSTCRSTRCINAFAPPPSTTSASSVRLTQENRPAVLHAVHPLALSEGRTRPQGFGLGTSRLSIPC